MALDFAAVLTRMVEVRASDVHLSPGFPPAVRVRGRITPLDDYPPLTPQDTREIVYSLLNDSQRKRFENEQQLDFAYSIPNVARFRVNVFFQRGAISAAFRHIPNKIESLDSLGLPTVLDDFARKPRGFVLFTGPTGSGKSTSLASMVDLINEEREEHILTIEDPIEFLHSHKKCIVNQREIGADAIDFSGALKSALREDPDVILVGEMRDIETISTALTAAETGPPRLRDAAHAVDRADGRPDHRRLPGPAAAPGADAALDRAPGDRHPAAAADRRRLGADRRLRGAGADARDPQPDPRGQDAPDLLGAADQRRDRDADDGRPPRPARADGQDHAQLAEQRASIPEELGRLLGGTAAMSGGPAAGPGRGGVRS